jgi:UTP--glucose-1-phosphate uridylyltransferase
MKLLKDIEKRYYKKMKDEGLPEEVCKLFLYYYNCVKKQGDERAYIREKHIEPIKEIDDISNLGDEYKEIGREFLDKLVYIKLNGGLGTTMGMHFPKSFLRVKDKYTFLDLAILQTKIHNIPLLLMNSFSTHRMVKEYLSEKWREEEKRIICFLQHKFPKILAEDLTPATCREEPDKEWNPPGHGDIYAALYLSGILEHLLDKGKKYAFVSNIDNLGATFDQKIYGYIIKKGFSFLMEVAPRLKRDKKGGHLAFCNNKIILREIAQCHPDDMSYFMDVSKHRYFNTNNIWIDLEYVYSFIEKYGIPRLPLIVNPKKLNPRDEHSKKVYQFETAMGSAISVFENTGIVKVGRNRYLPVKTTSDLLLIMSDCYKLEDDFQVISTLKDSLSTPDVILDERFYKKIDDFMSRFPDGVPSLRECSLFSVRGDVLFKGNIKCIGKVYIENNTTEQKILNKSIVSGKIIL